MHSKKVCHAAFTLATIDGGNFTLDPENGKGTPLVFHAFLPQDAALRYMWHPDNADTLAKFLRDSPAETHYLFISYGCESPGLTDTIDGPLTMLTTITIKSLCADDALLSCTELEFWTRKQSYTPAHKLAYL